MTEQKMEIFIFKDFKKYMNSSNRFKSYLISQLNNVKTVIKLENVYLDFKKELLPYLFDKKEVKVICNSDSYTIELFNEISENETCENDDDYESDCSTVDLNNNNIHIENDLEEINNNEDNYDDSNNQTYLVDSDESDEESLIEIAMSKVKLEDIKSSDLKKLSIYELRNILRNKELTISKNGVYLTKKELIKKLLIEKRKQKTDL
jgi:hypothetical protein